MGISTRAIKKEERIISGFTCNKCGESFPEDDWLNMQEMFLYRDTGGFGSAFGDMSTYEICLCTNCAWEVMGKYTEFRDES